MKFLKSRNVRKNVTWLMSFCLIVFFVIFLFFIELPFYRYGIVYTFLKFLDKFSVYFTLNIYTTVTQ